MKILREIRAVAVPCQICGLLPFYIGEEEDGFRLSRLGRWYGRVLAVAILMTSINLGHGVIFRSGEYKLVAGAQGDTEEINRTIETLLCISSYTMMVVSSVQNAPRHCRALRDMASIDEYLTVNGYQARYSCRWLAGLIISAGLGLLGVAYYYIHYRSGIAESQQFHLLLFYFLQLLYSAVFSLYLRTTFMNLANRIGFLNQRLDAYSRCEIKAASEMERWRELSNMIEMLCKFRYITENMNSVVGVAILFFFGFSFYTVTNQSYLAFALLTASGDVVPNKSSATDTMGLSCAWVVVETIIMAVICSACDHLASESNSTAQILARVYGQSKHYQHIIDKFLTKSIKQELQFTAYGFFSIDNTTLFKIFSAVTTYLVILIQFKQLEDSKVDDLLNQK